MPGYLYSRNGNNGSISSIYRSQGEVEAGSLKNLAITASGFIMNDRMRISFLGNIDVFTQAQMSCIINAKSMAEKNQALSYLRQEQEFLGKQIGVDRAYGKLAFAGIDLFLSSMALLGTKLVPDAYRLFQYIPADYELNFRLMSMGELAGEILPDSATLYSSTQTYFSLPVNKPDDPSSPLVPFSN